MKRRRAGLLGLLLAARFAGADILYSAVSFHPDNTDYCQETEITLTFQIEGGLQHLDRVVFYLDSFTRGACNNNNGPAISNGLVLVGTPSGNEEFDGEYYEGTVENMYRDSCRARVASWYLILTATSDVIGTKNHTHVVYVDSSNDIRPNCGVRKNSEYMRVLSYAVSDAKAQYLRPVNQSEQVNATCYMTDTTIAWRPAIPRDTAQMEIGFRSALDLYPGYTVRVQLAGWTSGDAAGTPGYDKWIAVRDDYAVVGNSTLMGANWEEGCCYEQHRAGFLNSTLVLTVLDGVTITAGTTVALVIPDRQGLRSQCGMPAQYANTTFSVLNQRKQTVVAARTVDAANAIGDGCKALDYCNGNGACDHCTSTCDCVDGFKADAKGDNSVSSFACSEAECPTGKAWAGMPSPSGDAHGEAVPCSGAGLCSQGKCTCFATFSGPACERRDCPGFAAGLGDCSGHGTCAPMWGLAMLDEALPLTHRENRSYMHYASGANPATWDADRLYGCVCDSSWKVGLGANETQEPEWFDPICSCVAASAPSSTASSRVRSSPRDSARGFIPKQRRKLRCPTGDDPMTRRDETDCSNVTAAGGRGVGKPGNKCHVDCSNRGFCDHDTGTCACFQGFHGPNCGLVDVRAVQIEV